jgi:anti-sigma regulatory factor (Ser/Thr protein kinase)
VSAEVLAERHFPAERTSPAEARRFVAECLLSAGEDFGEALVVAVSELVTNAVLHAASACRVEVCIDGSGVRVSVQDADPRLPEPRARAPRRVDGRGLLIVESLSDRWGVTPVPGGKVVWFELDR